MDKPMSKQERRLISLIDQTVRAEYDDDDMTVTLVGKLDLMPDGRYQVIANPGQHFCSSITFYPIWVYRIRERLGAHAGEPTRIILCEADSDSRLYFGN